MALFFYKEKNKHIRAAAYLRLSRTEIRLKATASETRENLSGISLQNDQNCIW